MPYTSPKFKTLYSTSSLRWITFPSLHCLIFCLFCLSRAFNSLFLPGINQVIPLTTTSISVTFSDTKVFQNWDSSIKCSTLESMLNSLEKMLSSVWSGVSHYVTILKMDVHGLCLIKSNFYRINTLGEVCIFLGD